VGKDILLTGYPYPFCIASDFPSLPIGLFAVPGDWCSVLLAQERYRYASTLTHC
jgi:hypothetical protein